MASAHILPSMLIFGPQAELPSDAVMANLRDDLVNNRSLSTLVAAIEDLQQFWTALVDFDPRLNDAQGGKTLNELQYWLHSGQLPDRNRDLPNLLTVPMTVILQITQYARYIAGLELKHPHVHILTELKEAGVQGFCIGFLSAFIIATARNEAEIGVIAATMLRLAVCIGAYVDKNVGYGESSSPSACIAVRWKDDTVRGREEVDVIVQQFKEVCYSVTTALSRSKANTSLCRHTYQASMTRPV